MLGASCVALCEGEQLVDWLAVRYHLRYVSCLDPNISGKPWSYVEDKKLMMLIKQHGLSMCVCCVLSCPSSMCVAQL